MLSPTYEITTALSHTDELISPPYDIAIVTISYGRVTMSSVWDSMMSKKNMGWPFYAAVRRWHRMNRVDCSFVLFSHITVMSYWALWRLKSPASRLFAQPFFFSDTYQIKFQRSASQNFVRENRRWLMDSPYKVSATRKFFPLITSSWPNLSESVISNEYCWHSFRCWVCSSSWWC